MVMVWLEGGQGEVRGASPPPPLHHPKLPHLDPPPNRPPRPPPPPPHPSLKPPVQCPPPPSPPGGLRPTSTWGVWHKALVLVYWGGGLARSRGGWLC